MLAAGQNSPPSPEDHGLLAVLLRYDTFAEESVAEDCRPAEQQINQSVEHRIASRDSSARDYAF